jgi:hypothetical protein
MEIFLRIPGGLGYTCAGWLVKGSAARVVAAQKSTDGSLKKVRAWVKCRVERRWEYCPVEQMRKS